MLIKTSLNDFAFTQNYFFKNKKENKKETHPKQTCLHHLDQQRRRHRQLQRIPFFFLKKSKANKKMNPFKSLTTISF